MESLPWRKLASFCFSTSVGSGIASVSVVVVSGGHVRIGKRWCLKKKKKVTLFSGRIGEKFSRLSGSI